MNHLIFIFYIISTVAGLISISIAMLLFLQYRKKVILLYALFIISMTLMILPNIAVYYRELMALTTNFIFELAIFILNISGFCMFFFVLPVFFHSLIGLPFPKIKKIIFYSMDMILLVLIAIYLLFHDSAILVIVQSVFLMGMILYGLILIFINFKKIGNNSLKKSLSIFSALTVFFTPLFIFDMVQTSMFFALPSYYFISNILTITFSFVYFNKPADLSTAEISETFIIKFGISEREKDVISLFIKGMSYSEIADTLFISYKTVDNHIRNIYQKVGVKNRIQLINLVLNKEKK